jgi:hypothetical protein
MAKTDGFEENRRLSGPTKACFPFHSAKLNEAWRQTIEHAKINCHRYPTTDQNPCYSINEEITFLKSSGISKHMKNYRFSDFASMKAFDMLGNSGTYFFKAKNC